MTQLVLARSSSILTVALLALAACGRETPPTTGAGAAAPPTSAAASSRYALASAPAGTAISVLGARSTAPRETVVVEGRVREVTKGLAAFTLIDLDLKYCGQGGSEEACKEPWDYCCHDAQEIASRSVSVQVREKGEVVSLASIPELRLLDVVVVTGRLVKEKDDVVLEATGWWRRERPTVPASIHFPE
ncbi:MAG: hypothetical protein IT460_17175 [Planctomycetes bacterium]|nr:hypothetical protein [Planctomycetota bacterium]